MKGVGTIVFTIANGNALTLKDALYVLGIKKNLLLVFAFTTFGFIVKFVDDRCTIYELNYGNTIVASSSLSHGLYKINAYVNFVEDVACAVLDLKVVSDAKIWHAHFGHLNFASLLQLQKFDKVSSLPTLQAPVKHVC